MTGVWLVMLERDPSSLIVLLADWLRRGFKSWNDKVYRQQNAQAISERRRLAYQENPQVALERARRWYEQNEARALERLKKKYHTDPLTKQRAIKRSAQWQRDNREKVRAYQTKHRHEVLNFPRPTRQKPTKCECCGKEPKRSLHLDHCHTTNAFRGWLCGNCNKGVGLLGDTVDALMKMLDYLKRFEATQHEAG